MKINPESFITGRSGRAWASIDRGPRGAIEAKCSPAPAASGQPLRSIIQNGPAPHLGLRACPGDGRNGHRALCPKPGGSSPRQHPETCPTPSTQPSLGTQPLPPASLLQEDSPISPCWPPQPCNLLLQAPGDTGVSSSRGAVRDQGKYAEETACPQPQPPVSSWPPCTGHPDLAPLTTALPAAGG